MEPNRDEQPERRGSISVGVLLALASQVGTILASLAATGVSQNLVLFWGATQWLVVLPLYMYTFKRGESATATGLLIMACIGTILCSICGALLFG